MKVRTVALAVTAAIVVWAVLFTNYPSLHDNFHELRHSLYVIPCH